MDFFALGYGTGVLHQRMASLRRVFSSFGLATFLMVDFSLFHDISSTSIPVLSLHLFRLFNSTYSNPAPVATHSALLITSRFPLLATKLPTPAPNSISTKRLSVYSVDQKSNRTKRSVIFTKKPKRIILKWTDGLLSRFLHAYYLIDSTEIESFAAPVR